MSRPATWCARRVSASKPRLASGPPGHTGFNFQAAGAREFWFRAARTWAAARRPAGIMHWRGACGSFFLPDTVVCVCSLFARGRARSFSLYLPRRSAGTVYRRKATAAARVSAFWLPFFGSALLLVQNLFLTAPVSQHRNVGDKPTTAPQRASPPSASASRRLRAWAAPRGKQNRPSPRRPRRKVGTDPRRHQGSPGGGGSTKYLLAKAPNFWTGQGETARDGARHEALGAAPSER